MRFFLQNDPVASWSSWYLKVTLDLRVGCLRRCFEPPLAPLGLLSISNRLVQAVQAFQVVQVLKKEESCVPRYT